MSNTDSRYCKHDWCKSEHHHPDAGVTKTYPTGDVPFLALNKVSIDVRQGEFLGIIGKISGAGKTTLLNMISGVSKLTSGSVLFHWVGSESQLRSVPIHAQDEDNLALWWGENHGIIYQSFELMPTTW